MVIISDYTFVSNGERCSIVVCKERFHLCPICGAQMSYRDSRKRVCKTYGGETKHLVIRRFKCPCGSHHTELPDCLCPNKHYEVEVIENVVDEVSTPEDLTSENYPCEKTMSRWKQWFSRNAHQIEGALKAIDHLVLGSCVRTLKSKYSYTRHLRNMGSGWLSTLSRLIYNCGHRLDAV